MTFYQFTKTTKFPFSISVIALILIIISYATGFYAGTSEGSFSLPDSIMWFSVLYAAITIGGYRRGESEESPLFVNLQAAVTVIIIALVLYMDFA